MKVSVSLKKDPKHLIGCVNIIIGLIIINRIIIKTTFNLMGPVRDFYKGKGDAGPKKRLRTTVIQGQENLNAHTIRELIVVSIFVDRIWQVAFADNQQWHFTVYYIMLKTLLAAEAFNFLYADVVIFVF